MAGSNLVQSILRGTEIVEAVSRSEEGMTLNQIAEQVGLKTTTVYNLLRSFCASDWLERDAEGKYFVGPGLLTVVRAGNGSAVLSRAMVILRELHESMKGATLTHFGAPWASSNTWLSAPKYNAPSPGLPPKAA